MTSILQPTAYGFSRFAYLICVLSVAPTYAELAHDVPVATPPRYILKLGLNEFSILNMSALDGLTRYGGGVDLNLRIGRETSNLLWTVTITNSTLLDALSIYVAQKTVQLIQSFDPVNLDPNSRSALGAVKSLSEKMDFARQNPVWDLVSLSGRVIQQGTNWTLETTQGNFKLMGEKLDSFERWDGKAAVIRGILKVQGEFEVTRMLEKKQNTLEVFVMSHCPFGRRAESKLLTFLNQTNAECKPKLEVHYIFYKQQKDGLDTFTSMHGEEEVVENLVQMAIRDKYPKYYPDYLRLRFANANAPWTTLVEQLSLSPLDEGEIARMMMTERDQMIRAEYEYASERYGIKDGSPTYVWESEQVIELEKVPAFKGLEAIAAESCSH